MIAASFGIRAFRAADLEGVVRLARDTLGQDAPSAARLARDFLLEPGFAPDDILVAERNGELVGYLLAPRLRPPAPADDAETYRTGWIAGFGVRADMRRRGIATALLARALDAMARTDLGRVEIADFPVRYLVPGVDRAAFPEAYDLLVRRFGFAPRDQVASMGMDLAEIATPSAGGDGRIRRMALGEIPQIRELLVSEFGWGWWDYMARSFGAHLAGDPTAVDILVAWDGGAPVGAVHYRGARFGPLGIIGRARRRGLGTRLTLAALTRMREHGLPRAYFLMAPEPAQRLYARLGFRVLRRFTRLARTLGQDTP